MKIAFCLSGGPRFGRRGLFKLIDALKGFDQADFFIRTWKTDEFGNTPEEFVQYLESNGLTGPRFRYPVVQVLDDVAEHHPSHIPLNLAYWAPNFLTMWWGIVKVNELRKQYQAETDTHYDLVLRMRTDMLPHGDIDLAEFAEVAQTHLLTANNLSENFIIAGERMYDLFVNYWNYLPVLSERQTFVHPEESLEEYFQELKIPYGMISTKITPEHDRSEYKVRPY